MAYLYSEIKSASASAVCTPTNQLHNLCVIRQSCNPQPLEFKVVNLIEYNALDKNNGSTETPITETKGLSVFRIV